MKLFRSLSTMSNSIIFRQLFDRVSCTYTYLLGCPTTKETLLIDPVKELVDRDLELIRQLGLKLRYVLNTHVHADHITGSGEIKKRQSDVKSVISEVSGAAADITVNHNDVINCGKSIELKVLTTPGHTSGCVSYYFEPGPYVFTGDALLIRACGRTDFQQGDSGLLYDSVHQNLFTLPNECVVYPAHDYNGHECSSIEEEKLYNPRLTKSREEFIQIMQDLQLDLPKMIDVAVPANMKCGI